MAWPGQRMSQELPSPSYFAPSRSEALPQWHRLCCRPSMGRLPVCVEIHLQNVLNPLGFPPTPAVPPALVLFQWPHEHPRNKSEIGLRFPLLRLLGEGRSTGELESVAVAVLDAEGGRDFGEDGGRELEERTPRRARVAAHVQPRFNSPTNPRFQVLSLPLIWTQLTSALGQGTRGEGQEKAKRPQSTEDHILGELEENKC